MMTALITILLAVFGSVQNAVGEVKVTQGQTWRGTTFVTVEVGDAGEFAKYLGDYPDFPKTYESKTTFIYTGKANSDDLAALSKLKNERINLSKLKLQDESLSTPEAVINAIKLNSNAEYLALPDADAELTKSDEQPFKSLCDQLKGVAYYYKKGKSYTCYSSVPGEVHILTEMTEDVTKVNGAGNSNLDIDILKISGNLNAKDVSANGWSARYDKDGHFALVSDAENVIGGTTKFDDNGTVDSNNSAFVGSNGVIKLDLSDAKFTNIADLTLSMTSLVTASTTTVFIPTDKSITKLPADFLNVPGANSIKNICIPYNIEIIGARAFYGLNYLNHVTTTDKAGNPIGYDYDKKYDLTTLKDEDGTPLKDKDGHPIQDQVLNPDVTDTEAGTMAFSANLQEIDSYAFGTVSWVKDVYVLADKAPACHVNAFSSKMYVGNSGYSPNGGITRADFINGDSWITMLHYPKEIQGHDEEKLYTDVTRDYTITDADGNADGNGNLLHWPNQTEFCRAYEQATNGYLWNAWSTKREAWSNLGSYSLSKNNGSCIMDQKTANDYYTENGKPVNTTFYHTNPDGSTNVSGDVDNGAWQNVTYNNSEEKLYDHDYRGWHQFVLATSFDYKSETPSHSFKAINDNGWWTICVPFDMTKEDVKKMFAYRQKENTYGEPHVCEFTGVLRDAEYADNPNTTLKGKIVLQFDRDVYNNVYKADGKTVERTTDDKDVVIEAGRPYLLQPDFETLGESVYYYPAKQVLQNEKCKAVSQVKLRSDLKKGVVSQVAVDKNGEPTNYTYTFVGNYWLSEMPKYAYFLAWYDEKNVATFFWQTDFPALTQNWNPYTAIIGCNWDKDDQKIFVPGTDKGNIHWYTRHNNDDKTGLSVFTDDSFDTSKGAKANSPANISIEAAGNTADGITKVHFGDRTIDIFHGKVYNLNGQYVGDSLEGLPKGIYIAAGKKYVVK